MPNLKFALKGRGMRGVLPSCSFTALGTVSYFANRRRSKFFGVNIAKEYMHMSLMPDPTFYPSPGMAMQAPPEQLAYVALLNAGKNGRRDAHGRH